MSEEREGRRRVGKERMQIWTAEMAERSERQTGLGGDG